MPGLVIAFSGQVKGFKNNVRGVQNNLHFQKIMFIWLGELSGEKCPNKWKTPMMLTFF